MSAIDPTLASALGIATVSAVATERTAKIWLRAVAGSRAKSIALAVSKIFPPILVFSFLWLVVPGTFPVDTDPLFLTIPLLGASAVIYGEARGNSSAAMDTTGGIPIKGADVQADKNSSSPPVASSAHDEPLRIAKATGKETRPKANPPSPKAPEMAVATALPSVASIVPKTATSDVHEAAGTISKTGVQVSRPAEETVPRREIFVSITKDGEELVRFKPPQGRRGGGPLHVRMMKVLYYFYLKKGWYPYVDEGDDPQKMPDLLVHELKWIEKKQEDGTAKSMVDPYHWKQPPFHVETETTPRKSKSQVILNYEKAWNLKRYVVFATPTRQDADDLQKIMDEINAPRDTYEIDDISDVLAEDLAHPEPMGEMEW